MGAMGNTQVLWSAPRLKIALHPPSTPSPTYVRRLHRWGEVLITGPRLIEAQRVALLAGGVDLWKQLFELARGLGRQALEDVLETAVLSAAVEFGRLDQAHDCGGAPTGSHGSREEPASA